MEGGEVEYWRIDEQCGLEEEEDEKGIVSKTTRWVLKAGLRLGKKVVITGIAVSSAPLVLPPLITICVVGFIVLVPVGVVLGSYACTEKLMSKLLPIPLLEYHSQALRDGNHQVEEEFGEELYGRVYEGEFALIQEEMKMEGEQRIELGRDNEEEGSEYVEKHDDKKGIGVDEEHLEEEVYEKEDIVEYLEKDDNIDEINMEKGCYEEDVGEVLDVNIDENLEDEEGYEEAIGESLEGEHEEDIDDENLDEGYEEEDTSEEYFEAEHKVKNEINIDDNLEEVYEEEEAIGIGKYLEGELEEEDEKEDENLEEGYAGEYMEGEGEHQEKNEISIDEDLEEGYEEDIDEYLEEEEHEGPIPEMNLETDDEPGRKEEELHYSEFGENVTRTKGLDLEATSAGTTENHKLGTDEADENFEHISLTLLGNVGSSSMNEDVEHLEKTSEFEEEEEEEDKVDNENPVFIGTEAKVEITTVVVVKETQLAPETEKQGNGENRNASEQVSAPEHNEINSNEGTGAPSSEVMVSEEKIWEQISAIRGILGYTAAPQSSTVDELKALFILTGVEPPSPFEDPSDLADVDEKLRLLMSIVGAK
ncbi:stress response protein NST1-like [Ipomoea triloba]|uniref:stress response protein NST1-like n=1 Tax=Ipomoea triloba TaxID=35885 RepID=UPI00125E5B71|nr:stress response protein NST1-like [Ipomoea triloba]